MIEPKTVPPDYEGMLETFYRSFLSPGDVCVDIGAHVGRHMYPMAECIGKGGRIFAIEPIPSLAEALRQSITAGGHGSMISVHELALSDATGVTSFVIAEDALAYSGLRRRTYDSPTRTKEIEVTLSTLDILAEKNMGALDYIKIDAEGAEWNILKGARNALEKFRPVVSFEFGEASYGVFDVNPEEVHAFFDALSYVLYDIRGRRLNREEFALSSRRQELWDYLAIPAELDMREQIAALVDIGSDEQR